MKTIITLTDKPDGSVDIHYMSQMTTEEIDAGFQPSQSQSYKMALLFNEFAANAKEMAASMRAMHAELAERSLASESAKCLH